MPIPASPRSDADLLPAWLRLSLTPGVGPVTARRLLQALGSPQAIFDAAPHLLRDQVGPGVVQALSQTPPEWAMTLERTQRWLDTPGPGQRGIVTWDDPDYPATLRQLHDAPILLYLTGQRQRLARPGVAIVGSRQCTAQGKTWAREFAQGLSQAGWQVLSGLAIGIDGAAHEASLLEPGGTLAVIATGPDIVYPHRHRALAHRIAEHGAIVSEFPPGTPSQPLQFPRRNRLIAGLASGVLVVEAGLPSGSLITAQLAADLGRDVFALPGPMRAPQSKGCHHLIKQGAQLVEEVPEILQALGPFPVSATAAPAPASAHAPVDARPLPWAEGSPRSQAILQALASTAPQDLDMLSASTQQPVAELQAELLCLELSGQVLRLPGGWFQRTARL